ncbi:MAG: hypothetical protein ACFFDI_15800 [Promethearchaeota archaeon]
MITDRGEIEDRKHCPRFEVRLNGLVAKEHRPRGISNRIEISSTGMVHQTKHQRNVLINHVLNRRKLFLTRPCDRDTSRPRWSRLGQVCPTYVPAYEKDLS